MTPMLTPLPNDGPVVRWAITHAVRYIINLSDRQKFTEYIAAYRHSRDMNSTTFKLIIIPVKVGLLGGAMEMTSSKNKFNFALRLYHLEITETLIQTEMTRLFAGITKTGFIAVKDVNIVVKASIPETMLHSMPGKNVGQLIEFPPELSTMFDGHHIDSAQSGGGSILINISNKATPRHQMKDDSQHA